METKNQNYYWVEVSVELAPSSSTRKTQIHVQQIDEATYACYFTDREYVLKYKSVGFLCLKDKKTGYTGFSGNGDAPFDLLLDMWVQIELKWGNPDVTLLVTSSV
jgi:hypothetical protein